MNQDERQVYRRLKNAEMKKLIAILIPILIPVFTWSQSTIEEQDKRQSSTLQEQTEIQQLEKQYFHLRSQSVNAYSKEIEEAEQRQLDKVVDELEEKASNTFEYHYIKFINSNFDTDHKVHLDKAFELAPNKADLYDDYIGFYEVANSPSKKQSFCRLLKQSGTIRSEVYNYNYNVLMSLESNALLFVNGQEDTYPVWVLQEVDGVRKDVTILNIDLMANEAYRNRLLKKLGLRHSSSNKYNKTQFIQRLAQQNSGRPVYFGLTFSKQVVNSLKGQLYTTGLAMRYSKTKVDNVPLIKERWETKFRQPNPFKVTDSKSRKMQMNYILPLMILWKNYQTTGQTAAAKKLKALILQIASNNRKKDQVEQHFKKME